MPLNDFCRAVTAAVPGVNLTKTDLDAFSRLYDRVIEVNSVMNITALHDMCDIALKHFADSLTLVSHGGLAGQKGKSLLDVGCGGGFPGLPVKLALPEMKITMLDSTEKKVRSAEETARLLSLENMSFVAGRAEELARADDRCKMRESFDFVTSRAVAGLAVLSEICLPFVKTGGLFLAMKGASAESELAEAKNAITMLGGRIEAVKDCSCDPEKIIAMLPSGTAEEKAKTMEFCTSGRYIIVIKKIGRTPLQYPRSWAAITKKHL